MSDEIKVRDCPRHSGPKNAEARAEHDHVMVELPENQAGEGRHKCPYCAYDRGYERGYEEAKRKYGPKGDGTVLPEGDQ